MHKNKFRRKLFPNNCSNFKFRPALPDRRGGPTQNKPRHTNRTKQVVKQPWKDACWSDCAPKHRKKQLPGGSRSTDPPCNVDPRWTELQRITPPKPGEEGGGWHGRPAPTHDGQPWSQSLSPQLDPGASPESNGGLRSLGDGPAFLGRGPNGTGAE